MSNTPEQTAPDAADGAPTKCRLAVIVFVLGVASLAGFSLALFTPSPIAANVGLASIPAAVLAFILGVAAQRTLRNRPAQRLRRALATVGMLSSALTIALTAMMCTLYPHAFRWTRELSWRSYLAVETRRVHRAAELYAESHDGAFPPVLDMLVDQRFLSEETLTLNDSGAVGAVCNLYYVAGLRRSDPQHWIFAYTDAGCMPGGRHVVYVGGGVEFVAESELEGRLQAFIDEYKNVRGVHPVIIPPH